MLTYLYMVSALCGALLCMLVLAFIFGRAFRHDCLAKKGDVQFLKFFSVHGAVVLSLFALFLFGLLYPLRYISTFEANVDEYVLWMLTGKVKVDATDGMPHVVTATLEPNNILTQEGATEATFSVMLPLKRARGKKDFDSHVKTILFETDGYYPASSPNILSIGDWEMDEAHNIMKLKKDITIDKKESNEGAKPVIAKELP